MGIYVGDKRYAPYIGDKRREVRNKKALPYDAEIEYLESTGTEWIDTGIVPDFSTTVKMNGIIYKGQGYYLAGARTGSATANMFVPLMARDGNFTRFFLGSDTSSTLVSNGYDVAQEIHFNEYQTHKVYIRGSLVKTFSAGNVVDTQTTLALFGINGTGRNHSTGKIRITYCQIFVDGVLTRDYIPVRKGTVGYLYDKVTKQLYGDVNGGSFSLGPDKN